MGEVGGVSGVETGEVGGKKVGAGERVRPSSKKERPGAKRSRHARNLPKRDDVANPRPPGRVRGMPTARGTRAGISLRAQGSGKVVSGQGDEGRASRGRGSAGRRVRAQRAYRQPSGKREGMPCRVRASEKCGGGSMADSG